MSQAWINLDAWLSAHAPEAFAALSEPAAPADIASVEREISLSMPRSLRSSYLVHNGEAEDSAGVFDSWQLLPLERVVEHWQEFVQLQEHAGLGVLGDGEFDAKSSIPVMWFESAIRYVKAEPAGSEGAFFELPRHGKPILLAASFGEFLEGLHHQLLAGELVVEPDFGFNVVPPGQGASGA
jgi:cell wall assembly regulator SMI1